MHTIRQAAVAGTFYPARAAVLSQTVQDLLGAVAPEAGAALVAAQSPDRSARGLCLFGLDCRTGLCAAGAVARQHPPGRAAGPGAPGAGARSGAAGGCGFCHATGRGARGSGRPGLRGQFAAGGDQPRRTRPGAFTGGSAAFSADRAGRFHAACRSRSATPRADGSGAGTGSTLGRAGNADRHQFGPVPLPALPHGAGHRSGHGAADSGAGGPIDP